jgi:hypothetical protein
MQKLWNEQTRGQIVKPRGTVFHLAPSNVDTIFVYSWMLSLLTGNQNIIRLSSKEQPQTKELLAILLDVLKDPAYALIAERTMLMTYEHDKQLTDFFRSIAIPGLFGEEMRR